MATNFRINDDGEDLGDVLLVKDEIRHSIEERQLDFEQPVIARRRSRWNLKLSTFSSGVWVLFSVWSILTARRVLTDEFPYPICFLVLLQGVAYICVTWFVLLIVMGDLLRDRKRNCQGSNTTSTVAQKFFIFARYCLTVCFSMAALIFSTKALMRFDNFSVLVMLPVLAYAIDSILFSFAHAVRLLPKDHGPDHWVVLWGVVVSFAIAVIVYDDYRIAPAGVIYAIVGIFCGSVGRLIAGIGPQVPRIGLHTWDCSSFWFLWAGMPPCLLITVYTAVKYENVWNAYQILTSWDMATLFANVAPGVLTHLLLNTPLRSTLQISTTEGTAYQIGGESVVDAIDATLYVSLLLLPISTLYEDNLVDWVQIGAFVFIFIISVGPKQISLYLPRFIHLIRRRSRESKWYAFWHKPLVLCTTTTIFALLTSAILMYWTNSFAYERSKRSWPGVAAVLDTVYRAPTRDRLEIVIAHSENDPIESVQEIISLMTGMSSILFFNPIITVYTKSTLENVTHQIVDGTGIDETNIKPLKNTGGVTATFLQHMLTKWDTLSTHTMFFHASSTTAQNLELIHSRINDFYTGPAGYPYPENLFASSGFLNLGDFTTCNCHSCYEPTTNWRDTFSLLPSMWGASHPSTPEQQSPPCQNILLTHGNNFIASAQRIRGIKKDVWTTLFEALTKEDLPNAWAHDKKKIGWAEGGKQMRIEGKIDSLEEPFLGYTVERLWAVLLQCSNREIAWKCPGMWSGWRNGGEGADCGCIDTWGT